MDALQHGPVWLVSQSYTYGSYGQPETREKEDDKYLGKKLEWTYELVLNQHQEYSFMGFVDFNNEIPGADQFDFLKLFKVTEKKYDEETIVLELHCLDDNYSGGLIEIIPVDSYYNELEYKILSASNRIRRISISSDLGRVNLKIRIPQSNILKIISARAFVRAEGFDVIHFPEAIVPLIDIDEDIYINEFYNPLSGNKTIQEYLSVFFNILFDGIPNATFDFKCNYRYNIADSGQTALLPVLLDYKIIYTKQSDETIANNLSSGLKDWYNSVSTPGGVFVFNITVYNRDAVNPAPVLHIKRLLLPLDSISGL